MNSTRNIMELIELLLADSGEVGIGELSIRTGIPKSTVQRFMTAMEAGGWVYRNSHTQGFRIGYKLLGQSIGWSMRLNLIRASRSVLKNLCAKSGQVSTLSTLDGYSGICIAHAMPDCAVDVSVSRNTLFDLHACAEGRVLLAFAPEPLIDHVLYSDMRSFTASTITDPKLLSSELEKIRAVGYAVSTGEIEDGTTAIAVPMLYPDKSVCAVLGLLGKAASIAPRIDEMVFFLRKAASELQEKMDNL